MSNENTAGIENAGRKMVSVNGKSLDAGNAPQGNISFVRPGKLTEADVNTVVARGIYEGPTPNNFDESKSDFKVRAENGDLVILNCCASLTKQLGKVQPGAYIEVTYIGQEVMTSGKYKGKSTHKFIVALDEGDYLAGK